MRDKCGRQVGDKCGNDAALDTESERQVWETSVEMMRPKTPRVKDKCGR